MRTPNDQPADSLPTLGSPIRPAAAPAHAWSPTETKGIERNPAGQVRTVSPEPKAYTAPAAAPAAAPEPAPSTLSAEELKGIADADSADWLEW
jgi:hypothetical protein